MIVVSKLRYNIMDTLMKLIVLLPVFAMLLSPSVSIAAKQDKSSAEHSGRIAALMEAIKSGTIAYKLTDPSEIMAILGEPQTEKTRRDGEIRMIPKITYAAVIVAQVTY